MKLATISLENLDTACGGQNSTEAKGNIGVDLQGKAKIGIQGEFKSNRTNYATCLKTMAGAGAKPAEIAAACGKPGGS